MLSPQLFCNPMNCSLPGSSVHGISQARILERVAISFSRGSSWLRDETHICISRQSWATWKAFETGRLFASCPLVLLLHWFCNTVRFISHNLILRFFDILLELLKFCMQQNVFFVTYSSTGFDKCVEVCLHHCSFKQNKLSSPKFPVLSLCS